MKFGERLRKSVVPEWRDKYIRFGEMKKLIAKINREAVQQGKVRQKLETEIGDPGEPFIIRIDQCESEEKFQKIFEEDLNNVEEFYCERMDHFSSRFENLVQHLVLLNLVPEYDPTKTAASQKKSVVEQKVSRLLSRSTVGSAESRSPRSARPAVANASVAANMPQDRTTQSVPPLKKVVPYHHDYSNAPEEPRSHPLLSIKRVVSYSRPSEEQANDIEMQDLGEVTSSVPSGRIAQSAPVDYEEPNTLILRTEDEDVVFTPKLRSQEHVAARKRLMSAFKEFYRGLQLLQSYANMNAAGFRKILKKHDKNVGVNMQGKYSEMIKRQNFHPNNQDDLKFLISETESLFATAFTKGDSGKAMKKLRVPEEQAGQVFATFQLGFLLGVILVLLAIVIYFFVIIDHQMNPLPQMIPILIGYRMTLSVIYLSWLWGMDVWLWTKARINYVFIFGFNARKILSFQKLLAATGTFTVLWLISLLFYLLAHAQPVGFEALMTMPPFAPLFALLVALFLVFFWYQFKSKFWLTRTTFRVAAAPFLFVEFRDFFLADQFVSLIILLYDIEFTICYFSVDAWAVPPTTRCSMLNPIIRPCLATIPYITRMLQCLRRVHDHQGYLQGVNAGKYLASAIVAILNGVRSNLPGNVFWLSAWIIAAAIATIYAYAWDVKMDWGLGHLSARYPLLRNRILYPALLYYVMLPVNLILRVFWIFSISPQGFGLTFHQEFFITFLSFSEITRRALWNLIRLENEQLHNIGRFHAVRANPLPLAQYLD